LKINKEAWDDYIAKKNPLLVSCFKSFEHGLSHFDNRESEDDRRFCIVEIDQAIELFLKGVLLERGKNPYHFTQFQQLLKEAKGEGLLLSDKEENTILKLHEKRNACQHEGDIPGTVQTEHLVHSAARFLLEKAEKALGISNEQVTDRVPRILFMGMKKLHTDIQPKKPEFYEPLEKAAIELLVAGDLRGARAQISSAATHAVEAIYLAEKGPRLTAYLDREKRRMISHETSFSPSEVIQRELRSMISDFQPSLKKLKLGENLIPFDLSCTIEVFPIEAATIEEVLFLARKGILESKTSEYLLKILRTSLLSSLQRQFSPEKRKLIQTYFDTILTLDSVLKDFYFLRNFITSNKVTHEALEKFNEECSRAFHDLATQAG